MILNAPAKTFLIGEYVATTGGPAIVLATQPSFSLSIDDSGCELVNIHPNSPAGLWYARQDIKPLGLTFNDPYLGKGGLGASSAQFVLVYKAVKNFLGEPCTCKSLLAEYYEFAWHGKGIRPSGYDVITQFAGNTLFIDDEGIKQWQIEWPFSEINVLLIHTNNKLATHLHLAEQQQPKPDNLQNIVYQAMSAWEKEDAIEMVDAINLYHHELIKQRLVAKHTLHLIEQFKNQSGVLAAKGCGAMGADVILLLVDRNYTNHIQMLIDRQGLSLLSEIAFS